MPIAFPCTVCRNRISVSRKYAGRVGRCPRCQAMVSVPTLDEAGPGADVAVAASSEEQPLYNTLAAGEPGPDDVLERERQRLDLERAQIELERAVLERERAALTRPAEQPQVDEPEDEEEDAPDDEVECPDCAEWIKAKAKVCRFCGCKIGRDRRGRPRKRARVRGRAVGRHYGGPNPAFCAALSFLIPGLGQIAAGEAVRGLVLFLLAAVLGLFSFAFLGCAGLLAWFAVCVFAIIDAYNVASDLQRQRYR